MIPTQGYVVHSATTAPEPWSFERRDLRPTDVEISIEFCGICHSDIHQARNEWGNAMYPMVPGHEIIGTITAVGPQVKGFKIGERAGIGCMVDSCRTCPSCLAGEENYCTEPGPIYTYNAKDKEGNLTFGGYSSHIVADKAFLLHIPEGLDPAATAPLLCAGITTYSPLKHWNAGPGKKIGIVGLGGLGHMALKFSHAFGAHTTLFTTSAGKAEDAKRLGADQIVLTRDKGWHQPHSNSFDFILDTVSAAHNVGPYIALLKRDATYCTVGAPEDPIQINVFSLFGRKNVAGSSIGGIKETQEMLDFCAAHNIVSDIEMTTFDQLEQAWNRVVASDVKYRFVLDLKSLERNF